MTIAAPRSPTMLLVLLSMVTLSSCYTDQELGTEITDEMVDNLATMPLVFTEELYKMTRNIGRSVTFSCAIEGEPPLNLYIYHDRIATILGQKKRMLSYDTIYDPAKPNELSVVYTINKLKDSQAGIYKCQGESINGQVTTSTMELVLIDPCEGLECGFQQQCINIRGAAVCTCDFECLEQNPVCAEEKTFNSMCHLRRSECRRGSYYAEPAAGSCPNQREVEQELSCTLSGEGHVTMFNGDYFTYHGACPYKMLEDRRKGQLIVYARTELCGANMRGVCLRSITIYVDRIYGFSIERGWLINDNGRSRNVQNGDRILLGGGAVSITRKGQTMVGKIENKKIEFYFDGLNFFKITVPADYVDKPSDFRGFCGTVPVDHVPLTGRDVSLLEGLEMPALGEPEVCGPAFGAPQCGDSEIIESVRSAFIDSFEFEQCSTVVPMDTYISRAQQDTCNCDLNAEQNYCFCNVLYAYVEDCRQAGVKINLEDGGLCDKKYHKSVFQAEGITYNRRRWHYNRNKKN